MKRFLFCIALIALVTGLSQPGYAASGNKQPAVAQKAGAPDPADFVGSDVCATCHAEVAKKFERQPAYQDRPDAWGEVRPARAATGQGKAHVEGGGDVTKIKQLGKLTPTQASETCLGCHSGAHPNFPRSPHAKAGVGCTSCHSVHAGNWKTRC